jgi:Arm DNA-binding domain
MPRIRLTKSAIDALPTSKSDIVYWDAGCPGFGIKITPKGRKVFIVLYRTAGAGSKLRKYTIGPYGRVTLHQARVAAQKVFAAKLEGRDPAAEKRAAPRRIVTDRVEDLLETVIGTRLSQNRSGSEIARLLRREHMRSFRRRYTTAKEDIPASDRSRFVRTDKVVDQSEKRTRLAGKPARRAERRSDWQSA